MNPTTEKAIREHAAQEYPREACGLIAVIKGKERYLPCRNIAESRNENFVLHPADYAKAEDLGEVLALVHSHPDAGNLPSEADRVQCAASGLPWYIVSVNAQGETSDIARYEPDGYEAPLVGRQFVHGILDCYTLVRDYYARELNMALPNFQRADNWWNKGENLYMEHFADAGFSPIRGNIALHDVIIMQVRSPVPNHAGVYIGNSLMLHHMYGRLSTREIYGGHYLDMTRIIVRHRELQK
jgi:proteasome lid subunit RPN8/RPN11